MQAMVNLLREDRAPAELMATYALEDSRRPSSEPCT